MKSHFKFNRQEQSGILFLLFLILVLQCLYFFYKENPSYGNDNTVLVDKEQQSLIDSLKLQIKAKDNSTVYRFNPNFISDYKGYTLGMSVEEIDRLHRFRAQGKFVNSGKEFQEITKISDSLLAALEDSFRFPEWKQNRKAKQVGYKKSSLEHLDINLATAEDFRKVNGIGATLSKRIVKFRDKLGGFLDKEQLYDVYGLDKTVADRAMERFEVKSPPKIEKININEASVQDLSALLYISYDLAESIIAYRSIHGNYTSLRELENVVGFPATKLHRIALYLSL